MILTLTVNPAIDHNVTADRLVFEDRAYIMATSESAGGRGLNASCVIHSFGGDTVAIATAGGETGDRLKQFLRKSGYPVLFVPIEKEIRTNLTVTDKHGLTVKLNEFGPPLSQEELQGVEDAVRSKLPEAEWLMLCGSLPPGAPHTFYSRLIELARKQGVKTMLDTDGDALLEGIEAGPTAVTPNQQETERLLNTALITRSHCIDAAARLHAMGAEMAIISLGSRGAVGASEGRVFEVVPPRVDAVCPIGAGDALSAAFVWALTQGKPFPDALRWGVAAGTASSRLPGITFASLDQTREVYHKVEVRTAK